MGIPQIIGTGAAAPLPYGLSREEFAEHRRQSTTSLIPRGRALFWEGEHQAQKIKIIEGVIRAVRLLENGNRQILAFYWPGDVVMPTQSSCQRITAEAVTNCRVQRSAASGICQQSEPCGAHQVLAETLSLVVTMSQKNSRDWEAERYSDCGGVKLRFVSGTLAMRPSATNSCRPSIHPTVFMKKSTLPGIRA